MGHGHIRKSSLEPDPLLNLGQSPAGQSLAGQSLAEQSQQEQSQIGQRDSGHSHLVQIHHVLLLKLPFNCFLDQQ